MTTLFWLLASLLTLTALALVLPPIWRQRQEADTVPDRHNIAIAKSRLAELAAQLKAGALTQAQYDEQRLELELALSDDLDILEPAANPKGKGRWMAYVLAIAIPLLTMTLYAGLGAYQAIEPGAEMLAATPAAPNIEEMGKMVAKLAERMKANPNDAEGWVMLGKSYKYLQQYPKAAEAFAEAYKLLGDKPDIMLAYADALAFANGEQLAGKPAELVFKVLEKEPDNVTALWYGGMAKAQAGDAAAGIKLWRKVVALLPPDSPARQETQELLAKLESSVPAAQETTVKSTPDSQASATTLTVQVSLSPKLQAAATPNDTVFIYAQALSGPKMPLAIVRKQVADLPVTVSLTDAQAMQPGMKLSAFATVKLLARISKSGNAIAEPGDLLGTIEQVATTGSHPQSLVIDTQIK